MKDASYGDFYLPEECIAKIISFTDPLEACKLTTVSSSFKSAADSDAVWEAFLPHDYKHFLSQCGESSLLSYSKKQIFLNLCNHHVLIDNGGKSFWLHKWSGKKCVMISARELTIVWGDTPAYWQWISEPGSRFSEVASLSDVCWLEISGEIRASFFSKQTMYAAYLIFKFGPEAYGFESQPVTAVVGFAAGQNCTRRVFLNPKSRPPRSPFGQFWTPGSRRISAMFAPVVSHGEGPTGPRDRGDGWAEVELGEVYADEHGNGDLEFQISETEGGHWKSGLVIEGIEIRPK